MKTIHLEVPRVMAINMTNGRLGYVVLEGPHFLVDWGVLDLRGARDPERLEKACDVIAWNLPDVLVLEDVEAKGCMKGARTRQLISRLKEEARHRAIETAILSRLEAQGLFEPLGATTRYAIARMVADRFPELKRSLPYARRAWESEHHNMTLFVAASFALAYFRQATG